MNTRAYCLVSGGLFALVALAHLLRVVFGLPIDVDGVAVPMLLSWIGLLVPAALAFWAFNLARDRTA